MKPPDTAPSLPHNLDAERTIIGTVLLHPEALEVAATIPPSGAPFHDTRHRKIWAAIHAVKRSGGVPELTAVAVGLRAAGEADLIAYASQCTHQSASILTIPWYVRIVVDAWRKRAALNDLAAIQAEALNGATPGEISMLADTLALSLRDSAGDRPLNTIQLQTILSSDPPPISWLVDGWLAEGDACILAGEWGTGKSLVAMDLALALATGTTWMGNAQCKRVPVLYVDEENSSRNVGRRLRQLATGRGITPEIAESIPVTYLTRNGIRLDDDASARAIHALIESTKARVIVLDSLIRFARMDENSNSDAAAFFDTRVKPFMARHDVSFVILDHMRKPAANQKTDKDPGHRVRGASDKPGFCDQLWTLEGDRASKSRTLRHEKARTDHPQAPLALSWEVSDDESSATITAVEEKAGSEAIILSALSKAGPDGCLRSELMDAMTAGGISPRGAERVLGKLHGQGSVKRRKQHDRTVRYWASRLAPMEAE